MLLALDPRDWCVLTFTAATTVATGVLVLLRFGDA